MKNWHKKTITRTDISALYDKYRVNPLTASILARREITDGKDVQYFLEDDLRFMHNPFLFSNMEDAVDRILQAKEENEKVLIFGDRDVDGITSTIILFDYLISTGIDAVWRLPCESEPYGLTKEAVDDFEKDYGSLIITVDCGIVNNEEIAYASSKGMDVIVLDHHEPRVLYDKDNNPYEDLPSPAVIINPKCSDSGYPFKHISGCAVAYKVITALKFSLTDFYKNEIALLAASQDTQDPSLCRIDILKTENLIEKKSLSIKVRAGTSITQTAIPDFLRGQQIFVWDEKSTSSVLTQVFGNGAEFNFLDLRSQVSKIFPSLSNVSLLQLKSLSKLARYNEEQNSLIRGFFNIFVTFENEQEKRLFNKNELSNEYDLQLVALAALADVMPLKNENRIFIRQGIASINKGHARPGLRELLSMQGLLGRRVNAADLSWNINPALNSTGRLGHPDIGGKLFLEKDDDKRTQTAKTIIEMNNKRKQLGNDGWNAASLSAEKSIEEHAGKLCVIVDDTDEPKINRGVAGTIAGKLCSTYDIPSIVVTYVDDNAIGSMRSCRNFEALSLLGKMSELFISYGGHKYAAGFSFKKERLQDFLKGLSRYAPEIELESSDAEKIEIDAQLPCEYLKPNLLSVVDAFEPYGEENRELTFLSERLKIQDALILGKTEKQHLKLTLDCGTVKWPAILWGGAEYLHRDFEKGDLVDVVYKISRNTYNGVETPQMIITDIRRSR